MKEPSPFLAAMDYHARGWSVFPLCRPDHAGWEKTKHTLRCREPGGEPMVPWEEYRQRRPTTAEVRNWWGLNDAFNIGLAFGPVSGLVGIDVNGPADEATLRKISGGDLPPTVAFGTGQGCRRLLYGLPPCDPCQARWLESGSGWLRIGGAGEYTVMPPSLHVSGSRYEWRDGCRPDEIAVAAAPAWLLELLAREDDASRPTDGRRRKDIVGDDPIDRAIAYLRNGPRLVKGEERVAKTVEAASWLLRSLRGNVDASLVLMLEEWNPVCVPRWTEEQLQSTLVEMARE